MFLLFVCVLCTAEIIGLQTYARVDFMNPFHRNHFSNPSICFKLVEPQSCDVSESEAGISAVSLFGRPNFSYSFISCSKFCYPESVHTSKKPFVIILGFTLHLVHTAGPVIPIRRIHIFLCCVITLWRLRDPLWFCFTLWFCDLIMCKSFDFNCRWPPLISVTSCRCRI